MPSDPPHTPQSPSQTTFGTSDLPSKSTSPRPTHSLPTPAHSINGSMSSVTDLALDPSMMDENLNKRKRDIEDNGDRQQKKVHVEDGRLSIEDLHIDVGEKYLLCKTPHIRRGPDTTQDLFELYGFNDLAKSVARQTADNPDGKRIRKTYKSVFKGLSGNFDVDKKPMDAPDTLFAMISHPDMEWEAHMSRGKEVTKGFSDATLSSMGKAFTMARGVVPKSVWNSSVLGDLVTTASSGRPGIKPPPKAIVTSNAAIKTSTAPTTTAARSVVKEIPRPKRSIKKRTYEDSSFEGYGEGYVDDDVPDTGYSDGEGDDRGGSRKRPKKSSASHTIGPMRQSSYGPGMVGA